MTMAEFLILCAVVAAVGFVGGTLSFWLGKE